jgi:hypothetical protein
LECLDVTKDGWLIPTFGWGLVDNSRDLVLCLDLAVLVVGK